LYVGGRSGNGAVEDNQRLCEFIYRNLGILTEITLTMDTHRAMQIFHPIFLVDDSGNHPAPMTLVTYEDVQSGRWRFNPEIAGSLGITPEYGQEHLLHYTKELKELHKYDLTIWPYHAMFGGIGHAVVSAVEEAIFFHTIARNSQVDLIIKGQMVLTKAIRQSGRKSWMTLKANRSPKRIKNSFRNWLILMLLSWRVKPKAIVSPGLWTICWEHSAPMMRKLAGKIYLLEDCTSPVVVPGVVDYTAVADADYQRFAEVGMHIVRSDQPLSEWPGFGNN